VLRGHPSARGVELLLRIYVWDSMLASNEAQRDGNAAISLAMRSVFLNMTVDVDETF